MTKVYKTDQEVLIKRNGKRAVATVHVDVGSERVHVKIPKMFGDVAYGISRTDIVGPWTEAPDLPPLLLEEMGAPALALALAPAPSPAPTPAPTRAPSPVREPAPTTPPAVAAPPAPADVVAPWSFEAQRDKCIADLKLSELGRAMGPPDAPLRPFPVDDPSLQEYNGTNAYEKLFDRLYNMAKSARLCENESEGVLRRAVAGMTDVMFLAMMVDVPDKYSTLAELANYIKKTKVTAVKYFLLIDVFNIPKVGTVAAAKYPEDAKVLVNMIYDHLFELPEWA